MAVSRQRNLDQPPNIYIYIYMYGQFGFRDMGGLTKCPTEATGRVSCKRKPQAVDLLIGSDIIWGAGLSFSFSHFSSPPCWLIVVL